MKDSFIQVPMETQHVAVTWWAGEESWRALKSPVHIWGPSRTFHRNSNEAGNALKCNPGLHRLCETARWSWRNLRGAVDPTCVLVRFHTPRFLDVNQLLSCWFLKAAVGECVWFGGVDGYCTHSLLSQHTHSHLTHTPDTHTFSGIKGWLLDFSQPPWTFPLLETKPSCLTLGYPPPSPPGPLSGMFLQNLCRILASFRATSRNSNLKLWLDFQVNFDFQKCKRQKVIILNIFSINEF